MGKNTDFLKLKNSKMRCFIFFLILTTACINSTQKDQSDLEDPGKTTELPQNRNLIERLYRNNLIIAPSIEYSSFDFNHSIDEEKRVITIESWGKISDVTIKYSILLKDNNGIYKPDGFVPSGDYEYMGSHFEIDGDKIDFTNQYLSNKDNQIVQPAILWYNSDFDTALKYYKLGNKEVFLINGINFYCNGSHCSSYQVFILLRNGVKSSGKAVYYQGNHLLSFENTHLFKNNEGESYGIYLLKDVNEINDETDFELFTINP
ncbi:MAG: hypothetical protein AAFZ15_27585 [Bacteroidota bacterium]